MIRNINNLLIVCIGVSLFSCDNPDAFDCVKKAGDVVEQEISLPAFHSLQVVDEMDVYLVSAPGQKIVIKAGKNLIPKIGLDVKDGVLTVSNKNSCNWVREPGNPGIYIYSGELKYVEVYDFVNVYSVDTLRTGLLEIYSDGTGDFHLLLESDSILIRSAFISNFYISGTAGYLFTNFTDDSRLLAKDLIAGTADINHQGSNRIDVFPVDKLKGSIGSTGSIYYYNEPVLLDVSVTSTGKLIRSY